MQAFSLEDDVDDYVKKELTKLGLMKNKDFNVKSQMSSSLKNALLNASKTKDKKSFGEPDFSLEKYTHPKNKQSVIPIIIENKLHAKNLKKLKNGALQNDDHSISKFAVNGALHYAQNILRNKEKYKECIAIGIAGDDEENLLIEVYYVFASGINSHKLTNAKTLHFLENQESFNAFYKECALTEEEKHSILIKTKADLNETAKKLNRLMHNHNITAPQRVLYVRSAGFLISSMVLMIEDIEKTYGKNTTKANEKIKDAKTTQLLGVELNAEMFSLATTNMILRGDGSSLIIKGNTFETDKKIYEDFKPNILLLNPPFSYEENGMPFIKFGLEYMQKGALGAIIIQDSAGSGQALKSNVEILKKHSLLASIKMPTDLFMPQAGVQTSVYIFKAHEPHDYEKIVKFIDFRNDGFKRTKRGLNETSNPTKRYEEIIKIYKAGLNAKVSKELWGDLKTIYIEDFIAKPHENKHAKDFNFEAHQKNETKPELEDFKRTIADYLSYEVGLILKNQTPPK